jgi:hypothetical protein
MLDAGGLKIPTLCRARDGDQKNQTLKPEPPASRHTNPRSFMSAPRSSPNGFSTSALCSATYRTSYKRI